MITVKKVEADQEELLAAVPSSFLQADSLACGYAETYPENVLLIRRGQKVLSRMEPLDDSEPAA